MSSGYAVAIRACNYFVIDALFSSNKLEHNLTAVQLIKNVKADLHVSTKVVSGAERSSI